MPAVISSLLDTYSIFLKDEIKEGKKVHLEKKEGTKRHKTTILSAPELDNFYLTHFKATYTDIFPSNET